MRILTFNDPQGAGPAVRKAAVKRGHEIAPYGDFDRNTADAVYVRLLNYGRWRSESLETVENLHRVGTPSLPSYANSLLYDDKLAQLPFLRRWLPRTEVVTRFVDAQYVHFARPFISKSAEGSASKNVRLLASAEQADAEIVAAFVGDNGALPAHQRGRGYLYWQQFIPGNEYDIRVVINGDNLYGLRRFNRDDVPFASGSGKNEPIRDLADPFARRAFELTREISATIPARWACYDFVRDSVTDTVYVLEVSFSWTEKAYAECPCFDAATLEPNGRRGSEWAEFAVDELERLVAASL